MRNRPTLEDVAERAGVSRALVSIVMRDVPGASEATRARVRRAADEIGYRPDPRARMLRALGLGPVVDASGCPIHAIRVTDGLSPRLLHFDSAEAEPADPLGYMLENRALRAGLLDRLRGHPHVRLYAPANITQTERGEHRARIQLADGRELLAPVILACDGRPSALRRDAEVLADKYQKALDALPPALVRGPVRERLVDGVGQRAVADTGTSRGELVAGGDACSGNESFRHR